MEWQLVLAILLLLLFGLLGLGVWIGLALGMAGVVGLYIVRGTELFRYLGPLSFNTANSFILTAVPLFVLMGEIILCTGISARFYKGLSTWLYRLPGGLLHSNIVGCAIFAAICGSSVATAATIGSVAIPELVKRGYDRKMVFGSIAAGGTLGILIPPSIPMIVYGAYVEESVAKLFMAGVLPGIVLTLIFMVYIAIRAAIQPTLVPPTAGYSWTERLVSLKQVIPVAFLVLLVLGGIYLGWATPTEAAALGACGSALIALAYRELGMKTIIDSLSKTVRTTAMIMLILVGGYIFSFALVSANIPRNLVAWILSFNLNPTMFLVIISLMYMVLGCFIEGLGMMLLTLPVIYPVVLQMGFSPIWFGVYLVIMLELSLITPPVAMNLFIVQGISKGSLSEVTAGTMPYWFCMVLMIALLTMFPSVALWLPSQMR